MAECSSLIGATPDDVALEVRDTIDTVDGPTNDYLSGQIAKAERRLLATCPTLRNRLATDPHLREIAKDIVVDAVARVARMHPEEVGLKSESEDGYSYTVDPLTKAGNLWFPDKDLALLGCGPSASANMLPRAASLTKGTAWHGVVR